MNTKTAKNSERLADAFYDSLRHVFGGDSQFSPEDVGAALCGNHNNRGAYYAVSVEAIAKVIAHHWGDDKDVITARIKASFEDRKRIFEADIP